MKLNRNIYILYAIALFQGMVFYGPVATLYRQAAGISIFEITLIESISLILCIGLEMPWGMAADRIGYRRTMIICCALYFLSKAVFWKADSFGDFLFERILLSVVTAGLSGCDISILYLSCRKGESQKVFGIYQTLGTAGLLFASMIYSLFIGDDYKKAGFLTMAVYGAAALSALGIKEVKGREIKEKKRESVWNQFKAVLKDRYFLMAVLGMALLAETNQTVTVFLSQLQYAAGGMSVKVMGISYIFVTLAGMSGMWSADLTKKLGVFRFSFILFFLGASACSGLAGTKSPILSVLLVILLRVASSMAAPLLTELENQRVSSQDRATVLSLYAVLMEGIGAGTNILFGGAAGIDLSFAMLGGAAFCVMGGGLFYWFLIHEGTRSFLSDLYHNRQSAEDHF